MFNKSKEETINILNSSISGLNEKEVKERQNKYGLNSLKKDKKINPILVFLKQFIDPLVFVLLAGFILSLLLKEYTDAIIIILIVILNASLSTFQECKAEKALKALSKLTLPKCIVKRNNQIQEINANELTVGDILILKEGNNVAADVRLINTSSLLVDESSLTGESVAILKDDDVILNDNTPLAEQKNMAFMSTSVLSGYGEGVVTNIGMNSQIGKIASLLDKKKKTITPLQKKLNEISKVLAITTVLLCLLIFIIAILQKRDTVEMLITAISLAVAVIPEGLLAVVTIVLSLGVYKMSKVNAIVKKLPSVETLGCVNVICSDKTGTLTQNKMSVVNVVTNNKIYDINEKNNETKLLAEICINCNDATINDDNCIGDPTEIALLKYAMSQNVTSKKRINCIPFDSKRKMMSTLNGDFQYSKGALEKILPLCNYYLEFNKVKVLKSQQISEINKLHDTLTSKGLRVIALAYKKTNKIIENNLIFVGLIALIDPPKENVKQSIQTLHDASINTIMITGDNKNTALEIAKQLNIASNESEVISGIQLDEMDEKSLANNINKYKVFARVSPENKVDIVKAFQKNGNVVAMTGDGVNDAPSLKMANIGVSMGISGTDVSKSASDMILMDDNFSTIEKAVKEGRGIFNNIKKTLLFLLSSNMGEVLVMLLAIIFNLPIPLIAIHILWVNVLTDTLPSLALGQDKVSDEVMKEKPRNINESIFAKKGWFIVIVYGLLIALLSFASYLYVPISHLLNNNLLVNKEHVLYLLNNNEAILIKAQTFAFSTLALSQLFHSFGIKNMNNSIFNKNSFNNKLLLLSLLIGIGLQILVTMVPFFNDTFKTANLNIIEFVIILVFSMLPLVLHEILVLFKIE